MEALWGFTSAATLEHYEKFRPPGAVRVALQGSVRALGRLRGDGGLAFLH